MNAQLSRITENLFFSLLVAALVGWSAVTVAADGAAPVAAASCAVAGVMNGTHHS